MFAENDSIMPLKVPQVFFESPYKVSMSLSQVSQLLLRLSYMQRLHRDS